MIKKTKVSKLNSIIGPGIVTGASDDDPSGIATYTQAGAAFGFQFLWTAIITYPLMVAVQQMCARIGIVTQQGLTGILKKFYPKPVLWLMIIFSFPAIILNISADLAGMGAVGHMLVPSVPPFAFALFFCFLLLFNLIKLSYRKISNILKFLCLVLLCYVIVPFLSRQHWGEIVKNTFFPQIVFDRNFFALLVGILGTTISPYLFFWQTSMEVEEMTEQKLFVNKTIIHDMKNDVRFGIFFSNSIFYFIILAAATELHANGITEVFTVDQAAQALKPLAGNASYFLFAFGVIGTGLLAIPVLAGSLSYIISEAFGWSAGLDKKFEQAKGFYVVMSISMVCALAFDLIGFNPVKALIYTAILYGLTAPVLIGIIIHICNNKKIMGSYTNSRWSNFLGILTLVVMTVAAIILVWQSITA